MPRCLITAGPTREHIDPVRFLSNASSGRMGYALAAAAAARGWQVDLVSGPVSLPPPANVALRRVTSAAEMFAACSPLFPQCDIFIAVAAVCDYKPRVASPEKTKKTATPPTLGLVPTIDILKTLAAQKTPSQLIIGFAAETHGLETYARQKLAEKNLDWIIANNVALPGIGMDAPDNAILMLSRHGARHEYGPAPKEKVADFILSRIA